MKSFEQLLAELCPNGVEFKKLGDVTHMQRGTSATKKTLTEGEIPVISGGVAPAFYCTSVS